MSFLSHIRVNYLTLNIVFILLCYVWCMEHLKYTSPVVLTSSTDDSYNFKPLPTPSGDYPYRLDIEKLEGVDGLDSRNCVAFHMVGDTGSARHSAFQATVARALAQQVDRHAGAKPAFLYHLGDIVYNYGEACEYPAQFLKPYEKYPAPIFAIAGNHDADINPNTSSPYQSLDAFMDVFCDTHSRPIGFGAGAGRRSMVQPNVYWTLETPLVRFIGLYANVTKHGSIADEQRDWFVQELRNAAYHQDEQALIVCVHHAPYSADTNHGSSLAMIDFLESAFVVSGVRPDAVCSGHVHSYQRFHKTYDDGAMVPYIVAGAGGYADLHTVALSTDLAVKPLASAENNVELIAYCDDKFGFLKMEIQKTASGLKLKGEYYTLTHPDDNEAKLYDRFEIPLKRSTFSEL